MSATALAPADQAPGERGVRGRVAALLVVAATVTFALLRFHGSSEGGGGDFSWSVQYTENTSAWSTPGLLLAAAALAGGGAWLWVARARGFVTLAASVAAAGVGLLAFTIASPAHHSTVSAAAYRSTRLGVSQAALMNRLGSPALTNAVGTPTRGGPSIGCLMYAAKPSTAPRVTVVLSRPRNPSQELPSVSGLGAADYFFCFDHGQLAAKVAS